MIGNTPLIKIKYEYKGVVDYVYAKLEYYNLTGSIKDRMVKYILEAAKRKGELRDNQPIIEATSGNTGISLAAIGAKENHPVYIFMPSWVSVERRGLMEMFGANVILVSKEEGGFQKAIELADELAIEIDGYRPNQFTNDDNISAHYNGTAEELINVMPEIGGFVSGIGTGGTLIGVGKKLKEIDSNTKVIGLEPDTLPILTKGITTGSHVIDGIGDDFIPEIVDLELIDKVIAINDNEALNMAKKIAKELGIGVGISSGANLFAAILSKEEFGGNIVTIFVDDNKKYFSTELALNDVDENYLTDDITLIDYDLV